MTEKQIENIKKKIKSHRAKLTGEKRKFGWYDDSYGRRYVIAELYIKIQDHKGALRYFNWFEKEFKEDIGFPDFLFYWTATLYENDKIKKARQLAYKTLFSNIYLIEAVCAKTPRYLDYKGYSNIDTLEFADSMKQTCIKNTSDNFRSWIQEFSSCDEYEKVLNEYVSLNKLIVDERPGKIRSELLDHRRALEKKYTND